MLSSEEPNRQAFAVHFGRPEDRNAPRIPYHMVSWPSTQLNPPAYTSHVLCAMQEVRFETQLTAIVLAQAKIVG